MAQGQARRRGGYARHAAHTAEGAFVTALATGGETIEHDPRGEGVASLERWFESREWRPFDFQREVWSAYHGGESGLIHAATGTGKTLAAWGGPLLEWLEESRASSI